MKFKEFFDAVLNVLKNRHSELEFQCKFWIFLTQIMRVIAVWNVAHRVIRNSDSNYVPIEGCKNGSLMFHSWIWFCNVIPIPQDQSIQSQIFGKKNVSGQLFTRLSGPQSYPKFGFQLYADRRAQKWKSNFFFVDLVLKYYTYTLRRILTKSNFGKKKVSG